jgi:hypothetical protein
MIKKVIGEEGAAEKNGYKTVMDRNNLSLIERRRSDTILGNKRK